MGRPKELTIDVDTPFRYAVEGIHVRMFKPGVQVVPFEVARFACTHDLAELVDDDGDQDAGDGTEGDQDAGDGSEGEGGSDGEESAGEQTATTADVSRTAETGGASSRPKAKAKATASRRGRSSS